MSDYSAVNPPTEKNQSQAFAAALQRAKEVRKCNRRGARNRIHVRARPGGWPSVGMRPTGVLTPGPNGRANVVVPAGHAAQRLGVAGDSRRGVIVYAVSRACLYH